MFDGDILNIIGLMDPSLVFMFRKFDPVTRMIISRDTSLLNEYFSINKGQLIDLYAFASIERMECDTKEEYDEGEEPYNEEKEHIFFQYNEKTDTIKILK